MLILITINIGIAGVCILASLDLMSCFAFGVQAGYGLCFALLAGSGGFRDGSPHVGFWWCAWWSEGEQFVAICWQVGSKNGVAQFGTNIVE